MGLKEVIVIVAILAIIICVPIQRRALNKIAFGRSMFISGMAVLMGLIVGMWPTLPATIIAGVMLVMGFGMMIFMSVKSYQHLQLVKRQKSDRT